MALAIYNQIGPSCTESWCVVPMEFSEVWNDLVYILWHDFFLH